MASPSNKNDESLTAFVEEVNGESHLRVEHDFGDGFVRLRTSEADRRQAAQDIQCSENIVLELLRNSRDAHASHIFLAFHKEGQQRVLTVIDDGDGIPSSMHDHVFEPRVTSKLDTSHMDAWGLHGRGMALFSIRTNAEEARVVDSRAGKGCSIKVATNLNSLGEKADQSTFPRFEMDEGGSVNVRGPRNIVRTACEFAIESRNNCSVYVGSPSEIASTLYLYGTSTLSAIDRAFCRDLDELSLIKRLGTASDPDDFARLASALGLDISSRTARRIIDGQIADVPALLEQITLEAPRSLSRGKGHAKPKGGRRLRVAKADSDAFGAAVQKAYSQLADQYYLNDNVDPQVRVMRDRIVVSIPLVDKD